MLKNIVVVVSAKFIAVPSCEAISGSSTREVKYLGRQDNWLEKLNANMREVGYFHRSAYKEKISFMSRFKISLYT